MKTIFGFLFFAIISLTPISQSYSQTFKSVEEAKSFFKKFDDEFNTAMVDKDSTVFVRQLASSFINCTPFGAINNKKDEIKTLLGLPLSKVERVAPQSEIFTYSGNLATLSVVKKLTNKNSEVSYVRRTIVYQIIDGKWQNVSGQGTLVPAKNVEQ